MVERYREAMEEFLKFKVCGEQTLLYVSVNLDKGAYSMRDLLGIVEERVVNMWGRRIGDDAVKNFMARVERLEEDLEEIKGEIERE